MDARKKPHRSDCSCVHLRRLARTVTRLYDEALADSGITLTQFSLLRAVQRNEPAPIGLLADELELDRTTLARNLRPLERDGLLATTQADADQRITEVRLTARGRAAVANALPGWNAAQKRLSEELGGARIDLLRTLSIDLPARLQTPVAVARRTKAR